VDALGPRLSYNYKYNRSSSSLYYVVAGQRGCGVVAGEGDDDGAIAVSAAAGTLALV
jgi:hypothetical protein